MEKRKRVSVRPFYVNFLKSIGIDTNEINHLNNRVNNPDRMSTQLRILEEHGKLHIIDEVKAELALFRERAEKFNGHIFLSIGADKKHLGLTMSDFKKCVVKRH
jgi:hypothetical protein